MLNKVQLIGHLGQDPEMRQTNSGDAVANFSIATSERWKDKAGERQEKTEWHRVVAFGKLADIIGQYVGKGSKIYVEGKLQTRKWVDNTGADRYSTEVVLTGFDGRMVMLDSKGERSGDGGGGASYGSHRGGGEQTSQTARDRAKAAQAPIEDEIPF